jgi:Skp family chaperone for outer membrane proteins
VFKKLAFTLLSLVLLAAMPAAAELKIASLDVQRAIGESDEAQVAVEKLQQELTKSSQRRSACAKTVKC